MVASDDKLRAKIQSEVVEMNKEMSKRLLKVKKSYKFLLESKEKCINAALKKQNGMNCAVCDPKWNKWVDVYTNDTYNVNYDQKTCDKLVKVCVPYL